MMLPIRSLRTLVGPTLVLAVALGSVFGAACASTPVEDDSIAASNLTNEELAKKSLQIMGAKGYAAPAEGKCQSCHDVKSKANLTKWKSAYDKTMATLTDPSLSTEKKLATLRRNPEDPTSSYSAHEVGILSAGVHLGLANSVRKDKHPLTYKQGEVLRDLFKASPADYDKFKENLLMPIEAEYPRLTPTEYETLLTWVTKGYPEIDKHISVAGAPTKCEDDYAKLKEHAIAVKSKTWAAINRDNRMAMFACESTSADPSTCFQQKFEGKEVFANAEAKAYGKGWALEGSTVRVLRELNYGTFFWMRSSADGRFVANGGGGSEFGGAVIADLKPALVGKTRDIGAEARYDPDFFPDDKGFMFQGTKNRGVMCSQSLLTNPDTKRITFDESVCTPLTGAVGLYQTIGQTIGDNEIGDRFVVNSKFSSDNHVQGVTADLGLSAGPEATIKVTVAVAKGNDIETGFEITQTEELESPYFGDTMMGRSGDMIGSRFATATGKSLGYVMHAVQRTKVMTGSGPRYKFVLEELGKTCMQGNKANLSFDERFLATHSYRNKDNSPEAEWAPYEGKGSADIFVSDFVAGKRVRVTNMKPGQFALFPHFRSDGWLYFLVRDSSEGTTKEYIVASDYAVASVKALPTP
jgi:hypothetical protein